MSISYKKILKIIKDKDLSSYDLTKKDKVIGQATWKNIKEGRHIDTRTINSLCKYLQCQPGDILEYVEDEDKKE